jgi:transposase-like protein
MIDFGCKFCSSKAIVRYGTSPKGEQMWWCKACRRKFTDNDAMPGMKTPVDQIGLALLSFYDGSSLSAIRRQLKQQYENELSDPAVYGWITKYSQIAIDKTKNIHPNVSDTWIADETVLQIAGKNVWFWDIMDAKTRFLLASHMSATRGISDVKALMEDAAKRAGKNPKVVVTDKLLVYPDGIERAFGADTKHIQSKGFSIQPNTNLIERLHGSIKARTKVMRGLKGIPSAYLFMNGWTTHYNFFRGHEALGDKTPAEVAGVTSPFKNWLEVASAQGRTGELPHGKPQISEQQKLIIPFARKHARRKLSIHQSKEQLHSEISSSYL